MKESESAVGTLVSAPYCACVSWGGSFTLVCGGGSRPGPTSSLGQSWALTVVWGGDHHPLTHHPALHRFAAQLYPGTSPQQEMVSVNQTPLTHTHTRKRKSLSKLQKNVQVRSNIWPQFIFLNTTQFKLSLKWQWHKIVDSHNFSWF